MEVNKLSFKLYKFLIKQDWLYKGEGDKIFFYLSPSPSLQLNEGFKLALPIHSKTKDFYRYMKSILDFLNENNLGDKKQLHKLIELNENLKNRFLKEWIIPEHKSKIPKINQFDVYIPRRLKY